jgi:hypothetical protein
VTVIVAVVDGATVVKAVVEGPIERVTNPTATAPELPALAETPSASTKRESQINMVRRS